MSQPKRLSAVIQHQVHHHTTTPPPPPLNLIPIHSSETHHHRHHSIRSQTDVTTTIIPSPSPSPSSESNDIFLPLHSTTNSEFTFPTNNISLPTSSSGSTSGSGSTSSQSPQHHRHHSRVHSRNLSVFFPRPNQSLQTSSTITNPSTPITPAQVIEIPSAKIISDQSSSLTPGSDLNRPSPHSSHHPKNRRGHHHRHSLSHNFFPFLPNPNTPNRTGSINSSQCPSSSAQATFHSPSTPSSAIGAIPRIVPSSTSSLHHLPPATHHQRKTRGNQFGYQSIRLIISILIGCLGARLWLSGQLELVGIGYLVVCEALGIGWDIYVQVLDRSNSESIGDQLRRPFGIARYTVLARFTRSIYLWFAGMYICKEAIEQLVLIESHHHHHIDPTTNQFLLLLAIISIGLSRLMVPNDVGGGNRRLCTLAFASIVGLSNIYASHMEQLVIKKLIGIAEVMTMCWLALPETVLNGKILLQISASELETSSSVGTKDVDQQTRAMRAGLEFIKRSENSKVKKIFPVKQWILGNGNERLMTNVKLGVRDDLRGWEAIDLVSSARHALSGVRDEVTVELVPV